MGVQATEDSNHLLLSASAVRTVRPKGDCRSSDVTDTLSSDGSEIGLAEMIESLRSELETSLEKGLNRAVVIGSLKNQIMPVPFPVGSVRIKDFNSHFGKLDAEGECPACAIQGPYQDDAANLTLEPGNFKNVRGLDRIRRDQQEHNAVTLAVGTHREHFDIGATRDHGRCAGSLWLMADTYGNLGYKHVLVIYDDKGKMVKDFKLEDLLTDDEIKTNVRITEGSRWWAQQTQFSFDGMNFVARLKWGKTISIDVNTGKIAK